jgi:hypothetical protein
MKNKCTEYVIMKNLFYMFEDQYFQYLLRNFIFIFTLIKNKYVIYIKEMSNEISNDVEVEVYYYSIKESVLSTQQLNYVNLNIENNKNIDYETTRTALLYSQNGELVGKIISFSTWQNYNNIVLDIKTIRLGLNTIVTKKGTIGGIFTIVNPQDEILNTILTQEATFKQGYYYGKKIIYNLESIPDTDVIKITVFINC